MKTLGATGDPKREAGQSKPGFTGISPVALMLWGYVMRLGATKYGEYNWAEHSMKWSTYYSAIMRHLLAAWLGEDDDPESGVDHLAHIIACCGILIEQRYLGKLIDDRPKQLANLSAVTIKLQHLILSTNEVNPKE